MMSNKELLEYGKEIAREINSGKEFTYNGKKVNYAICGNSDYNQPLFILGYDDIREAQCFMNHGYVPYIIENEIKFLKKDEYFTFEEKNTIKNFMDIRMMRTDVWAETPTGIQFKVRRVNNDMYGNPMYHIEFDYKTWQKIVKVPSKERAIGRLYKEKFYITFQSYNLSDTIKYLFKNLKLNHGLED